MFAQIKNKQAKISVIGLGYVGLPIALEFAKQASVIGFDIKPERIELMKKGIDPSKELESEAFEGCDIQFTANPDELKNANFHIVAVPTPIDDHNQPDLTPVISASKTVGRDLKKGDYVVFESTVYPGCTEEDCVHILEELSGLKFGVDFKLFL
jgi:UDP-N-acetyl-D-galactosamine dehydrogenase